MNEESTKNQRASIGSTCLVGERDYPIGIGENDNYGNVCVSCDQQFRGPEHYPTCRKCKEEWRRKFDAMTPEEKQAHHERVVREVSNFFAPTEQK